MALPKDSHCLFLIHSANKSCLKALHVLESYCKEEESSSSASGKGQVAHS